MAGKRSQTIDAIRGAAILIVMFGHVLSWNHMEDAYVYDVIKVVQMPLFIMISGYLCGIGRHADSWPAYRKLLGSRAVSYLVPFFFWIILLHPTTAVTSVRDTLFALDKGLWFLMTLFLLMLMLYTAQLAGGLASRRFPRLGKWVFWLVYLALVCAVVLETLLGVEFLSPGLTRLYLPFFAVGWFVGEHRERLTQLPETGKWILTGVSLIGLLLLAIFRDLQDVSTLPLLGQQVLASFLGCGAAVGLLSRLPAGRCQRFLAFLGRFTLEIYVLHFHFATVLNRGETYSLYSWQGQVFVWASFVVMGLITAAIIAVTKRIRLLDFLLYGKLPGRRVRR